MTEPACIAVSACLLGARCKYNGGHNQNDAVITFLRGKAYIPICPEAIALPTPRPPVEINDGRVVTATGEDRTAAYEAGVTEALERLAGRPISMAILKARSPTCGSGAIYDGTFTHRVIPGDGLLAAALKARGIPVRTEEDIEALMKGGDQ